MYRVYCPLYHVLCIRQKVCQEQYYKEEILSIQYGHFYISVYAQVYIHMYICIYTYMHTHIHAHTHAASSA